MSLKREGAGGEEGAPFGQRFLKIHSSSRAVGRGNRVAISKVVGSPGFWAFHHRHFHRGFFFAASFPTSQSRRPELLEQVLFGLLHLLRRRGVAAHGSNALQGSQRKSLAQVLSRVG